MTDEGGGPDPAASSGAEGRSDSSYPGIAYELDDWQTERDLDAEGTLSVGDRVSFAKTVSEDDVRAFARATGDTNRLHLDAEYAAQTRFGGPIVHGGLLVGVIGAALARLPGVVVYLSQEATFARPVGVGDRIRVTCTVTDRTDDGRYRLRTTVGGAYGNDYVTGEAAVLVEEPSGVQTGSNW